MKKFMSFMLVATILLAMVGCGKEASDGDAGKDSGKEQVKIGLSMNTLNNPFFVDVKEGAEKAANENDVKIFVTDAQNQPSKQHTDVESLLQKDLDLIIIDPCDSDAIVAAVEAANEKGVPVITIDRAAKDGEVVSHIGFDAIHSGNIAGNYLAEQLGGTGKIVEIMGIMGTNVAQDRSKGFNQIVDKTEGFEVVATQSANFDRAEAMQVMENILQANKEIDGIYAANDEMALGALEAIEAAGRLDEITLIGCDAIDPSLNAIREGKLEATIAEPPFFLGKNAVLMGLDHLNGKSLEKNIILDSTLVTSENVNDIVTKE
jgi:ribose transport system substrate-binding protein